MSTIDYIGFDIHKKTISFCVKAQDGTILEEGTIPALRKKSLAWAKARPRPWIGAMEATLFTGWVYGLLRPLAQALQVAHPPMVEAIAAAKKKNDKVDARMIGDLLRYNLLPECYMAPVVIHDFAAGASLPQSGGATGDANEEPHRWSAHGNRDRLQQGTAAWQSVLQRVARKLAPFLQPSVFRGHKPSVFSVGLCNGECVRSHHSS
jgi:hypothetical protein